MAKAEERSRLRLTGESLEVDNSTPLALSDPSSVYIVEEGELVAFAVEMKEGEAGPRHFLMSVQPGEAIFGIAPTSELEVFGTGNVGTRVRQMPLADLDKGGLTATSEIDRLVRGWVEGMESGCFRYLPEEADTTGVLPMQPSAERMETLSGYGAGCLTALRSLLEDIGNQNAIRLQASVAREEQVEKDAITQLAAVLATEKEVALPISDDPLLAACRSIGDHKGIEILEPARTTSQHERDRLRSIAKASRIRTRKVVLEEQWWKRDGGSLLGFEMDTNAPVALIPTSARGYELINHQTGERKKIDAEVARTVGPEAFLLYRVWPATPLKARHILGLGVKGTGKDVARIGLFGLASALLALITPIATAELFNSIIPTAARARLGVLVGALLLGAIAAAGFQLAQSTALTRFQTRVNASLSAAMWDRILRLPVPFFRQFSIGDLAQRALSIDQIRQILAQTGFSAILTAIFSLSSLVLLFVYDPTLALIAMGLVIISVSVTAVLTVMQVRRQRTLAAVRGELSGLVIQQITGVSKLRVSAAERRAFAEWTKVFSRQQEINREAGTLRNLQGAFNAAWPPITSAVVFWWLSRRSFAAIDPGTFLAFFAAFGQVLAASRTITGTLAGVMQAVPLWERAKPILEAIPEVDPNAADPGTLTGALEVKHVQFRYVEDGPIILNDVSISVEPGQFVAVVGPSGAGKSSLIRLLLGFEKPEAGAILYDGQDLETLDVELVRRQIGVVLQTAQLIPGNVYTNIVGESGLSRDDAWAAAKLAGLDADLQQMPMGMDTLISEGSSSFSGGQKQRLLIARALATKPRFLLFDEATSALDNITQRTVTESLAQLDVTRIVIAHRLSTILGADKIVVMERGRVVEEGTYDELMAHDGPFHELAARQIA